MKAGRRRWLRSAAAVVTTTALALGSLVFIAPAAVADTAPPVGVEETVSSDPLPTAQINGVVWTQAIARNTVWVGGEFTNARPAGAAEGVNTSPRANLMAYNLQTGVMTSWNPGANGSIKSIVASPDGSRIYVGGTFTTIAGQSRNRIAAFDTATGALLSWAPYSNAGITALAVHGDTVFVTGNFSSFGGGVRTRLAAVSASTGALLPLSATIEGGYGVTSIVVDPTGSKIVVAGSFLSTNGSTNPGRGLAALNASTGASMPWAVNSLIRNAGTKAAMTALTSDGDSVYGTGYDYGGGAEDDFEGTFRARWSDGALVWLEDCHGDNYSLAVNAGVVYTASHDHYCGNIGGFPQTNPWTFHHSLAFAKEYHGNVLTPDIYGYKSYTGQPAATNLHWYPDWQVGTYTGKSQATWDVVAGEGYVLYGGEFLKVNNKGQQGLVRFATKSTAPNKSGPQQSGDGFPVSLSSLRAGEVRVAWTANTDRDNATLTYQIFRQDKGSTPIYTVQGDSNFWTTPRMTYADKTAVPGQTYQYRVRAIDSFGNQATGSWSTVTAASANQATDYSLQILDDGAFHYWPLSETSGTVGTDLAGADNLVVTGATRGATGPNLTTATKATQFSGSSSSYAASPKAEASIDNLTVEAWFKTTSTRGGKVVNFGTKNTGNSGTHDRSIYLDNSGRVTFGVYPGAYRTISSSTGFNDGQWHHVVGTMSPSGMTLYLDGVRIGTRVDTTSAQTYDGYWRVGGDTAGAWPNVGTSGYLNGQISDVAIYNKALTRTQVNAHWTASGRSSALPAAPADAYGKAVYDLAPTLYWRLGESSGSTATDSGLDGQTGTYFGAASKGAAGAISGVANTAVTLAPTKSGTTWNQTGITSDKLYTNPTTFSVEAWFKTNTTTGGKIVGFGNQRTGLSGSYDRHIYMTADGKLNFGVQNGSRVIVSSATSYNNNQWHHVVGQMSTSGMQLYVDGTLVGTNPNTAVTAYNGYWRVGGDTGWAGDTYWKGSIDEVAVYPSALTAAQIRAHFQRGALGFVNQAPVAAFSSIATDLAVALDASTSSDADNEIVNYSWNFGDGFTAEGLNPSHTFLTAGIYEITLTTTDALGETATITQEVTVAGANALPTAVFTTAKSGLTVSVDGTASTDSDGSIATYSWAFGDGSTGQGATASRTYATPGSYTVTLTVTDDRGGSTTSSSVVEVVLPQNVLPTASFTSQPTNLSVAFDGGASTDTDGTITGYAWSFGDGTTGSGATAQRTYSTAGTYQVTLTVTDDRGGQASVTNAVTVSLAPNQLPTASFVKQTTGLTVSVDGAASSDPDGTIASYAWSFGDGATETGATATHVYNAAGTYTVQLTVTDNRGGTATSTSQVTVAVTNVIAADAFDRTFANGWGTADRGGAWTVSGTAARFAVGDGAGSITLTAASTQQVSLAAVSSTSTRLATSFSVDKIANAQYISFIGRQVGADQYLLRVRIATDGSVIVHVMRGGTAIGASYTVPGLTITPGATYNVVFDVTGTSPTTLAGKIWKSTDAEPATASVTRTDSTAALQAAGSVGLSSYVPTSANAFPLKVSFADVTVTDPAVTVTPPAPNVAPTAALTASVAGSTAALDASTSADSDGTIASYQWSFGDGQTRVTTSPTTSYTYAGPGTFTVSLTVTDDKGAVSTSATRQVTIAAAPPQNVAPVAAFTSAASGLGVSVDGSSSTDSDGTIVSYAWAFGDSGTETGATASHSYTAAGTYTITLTVTDNAGATNVKTAQVTVAAVPAGDNALAKDLFERIGANGWGNADQGGAWTTTGTASRFSVADGAGKISVSTGQAQNANLASVSSASTRVTAEFSVDKVVDGQYIAIVGRQVGASQYILRLRPENGGQLRAYVLRDSTAVGASFLIPGVTLSAGEKFTVSFEVTGSGTTALNAKVWKSSDTEPVAWQVSRTDTTAAMQGAGSVGVFTWLPSAAAAAAPVAVSFHSITVIDPAAP